MINLLFGDVLAKTTGLYQGPKLRILNSIFLDGRTDGPTDRHTYLLVADNNKLMSLSFLYFCTFGLKVPMNLSAKS